MVNTLDQTPMLLNLQTDHGVKALVLQPKLAPLLPARLLELWDCHGFFWPRLLSCWP